MRSVPIAEVVARPTYVMRNGQIFFDEILYTRIGQVGTQLDGLGHAGFRMTMADGSVNDVFYNGFTLDEMYRSRGFRKLGVEKVKPFITRGIVIDVAGYKGVETLPHGYEVTLEDVRGALSRQGLDESDIEPGDGIFMNYGWSDLWKDPEEYLHDWPTIEMEVAEWVVERKASIYGEDVGTSTEVHVKLLAHNGIFLLEHMVLTELCQDKVYEFLFIFAPVPFKGATGSPGRPLAIR